MGCVRIVVGAIALIHHARRRRIARRAPKYLDIPRARAHTFAPSLTVLIGSSVARRWPRDAMALGRVDVKWAVDGMTTTDLVANAPRIGAVLRNGDTAVVYCGSNDFFNGVCARVMLRNLRAAFSHMHCRILYVGVVASPFALHHASTVDLALFTTAVNAILAPRADGSCAIAPPCLGTACFLWDGLHLNAQGYDALALHVAHHL